MMKVFLVFACLHYNLMTEWGMQCAGPTEHARMCKHTHTGTQTRTQARMHTHAHTHAHTHIHTHTHINTVISPYAHAGVPESPVQDVL